MLTYLIPTAKEMKIPDTRLSHSLSEKSSAILQEMSQKSVDELATAYKIKSAAAEKEALRWQAMLQENAPAYPAAQLFNGLMYRHLDRKLITAQSPVYITSSFYGIIQALAPIAEHRHDFHTKMTVAGQSLKTFWRPAYDAFAEKQDIVVSLLSSEFSDVFSTEVRKNFISLTFLEEKNGQVKSHSTISKKARGAFLSQALKTQAEDLSDLKTLTFDGFAFSPEHSQSNHLTFIKKLEI